MEYMPPIPLWTLLLECFYCSIFPDPDVKVKRTLKSLRVLPAQHFGFEVSPLRKPCPAVADGRRLPRFAKGKCRELRDLCRWTGPFLDSFPHAADGQYVTPPSRRVVRGFPLAHLWACPSAVPLLLHGIQVVQVIQPAMSAMRRNPSYPCYHPCKGLKRPTSAAQALQLREPQGPGAGWFQIFGCGCWPCSAAVDFT